MLDKALEIRQNQHASLENDKLNTYRAGNTGIKLGNKWYGKCGRKSWLRSAGIEHEHTDRLKFIMFSGGVMNEEVWDRDLKDAYPHNVLSEEEIPTKWFTEKGTPVSGRPDKVLLDADNKPVLGLELKMVSSIWTARDVLFMEQPKFDHMTQAAHYMWQLNVPFKLCYTSYVEYAVTGWMGRNFPKLGQKGSEYCDYNDKGDIKKVRPFVQIYDLMFDSLTGTLLHKLEDNADWIPTVISIEGIKNYFAGLDEIGTTKKLPPRPETINIDGSKEGYSICNYCPIKPICDAHEGDKDVWVNKLTTK